MGEKDQEAHDFFIPCSSHPCFLLSYTIVKLPINAKGIKDKEKKEKDT